MKNKSLNISIWFTAFLFFSTVLINFDNAFRFKFSGLISFPFAIIQFIFFYFWIGIGDALFYIKYSPPTIMIRIDEWLLTPLFYGLFAYLLDRFILTRFVEKILLRVLLLLLIFAATSIPVLIWHPPLATF